MENGMVIGKFCEFMENSDFADGAEKFEL